MGDSLNFWKETDELFEIYRSNYNNLRIEKQDFRDVTERLRRGYETETHAQRERIERVERENLELTQRLNGYGLSEEEVKKLSCENEDLKDRISKTETKLAQIESLLIEILNKK